MLSRRTRTLIGSITLLTGAGALVSSASQVGIPQPPICYTTAVLAFTSANRTAEAEFWIDYANCLNDTEEDLTTCLLEKFEEGKAKQALALEQFKARLELCVTLGEDAYDPDYDGDDFTSDVDAEYFPLVRGRTLVYEKQTSEGLERVETTTLDETFKIDDVECQVVRDVAMLEGVVIEDTLDWFAQDEDEGDVWYLGELSINFEDGMISDLDGSWRAGVDGAKAGIQMRAVPLPGETYRQEFLLGEAEDVAQVISIGSTVVTPAGTFRDCLEIEESSPIEPGVRSRKYYAPGIGLVRDFDPATGESLELIAIICP